MYYCGRCHSVKNQELNKQLIYNHSICQSFLKPANLTAGRVKYDENVELFVTSVTR